MQLTTVHYLLQRNRTLIIVGALLIGTFTLFAWLRQEPVFLDGDPFYHAKIAQLMIEQRGIIKEFPWIPGSVLEQHFTDHHFLYHVLLIPFVAMVGDPLIAVRIASIFFASVFVVCFYFLLRYYSVRAPFAYTLLLLISPMVISRINLDKAPAVSLILLLAGLYALAAQKKWLLFTLSFLYVWLYDAWPLFFIASFLWCFAGSAARQLDQHRFQIASFFNPRVYVSFFFCVLGLAAGIIINPYFPDNLAFFKTHLFSIALATKGLAFGIGQEWFPVEPFTFIRSNIFFSILWLCTISWSIVQILSMCGKLSLSNSARTPSAYSQASLFFGSFSILLFLATVKSQRMAEYFIPIGILFIACSLHDLMGAFSWAQVKQAASHMSSESHLALKVLGSMTALIAAVYIFNTHSWDYSLFLRMTRDAQRYPFHSMQRVSEHMNAHIPRGAIIATNDWSFFPQLMYYADSFRYVWGLDPTFTHDANPEKYTTLFSLVRGEKNDTAAELLKKEFSASYLLLAKQDKEPLKAFSAYAAKSSSFKKEYEDTEAILYAIR
ncbi:MAG: hypothetical protein AAB400_04270 [Patescibacteria group bacterium]